MDAYIQLPLQVGDFDRRESREAYNKLHLESEWEEALDIELANLFDVRADTKKPRTVLIKGRAGIGKSTLLRKIVHDWAAQLLWKEKFQHIFRFPLKFFNSLPESHLLSCHDLLMRHHGPNMSQEQKAEVWKDISQHPDKNLILFDGLDEYRGLDNKTSGDIPKVYDNNMAVSLPVLLCNLQNHNLLTGACVAFSSRPKAAALECFSKFDRRVEIKGFNEKQIRQHIRRVCGRDVKKAEEIIAFLDAHSDLKSHCYIPGLCAFIVYCISLILDGSFTEQSSEWYTCPKTITQIMTLIVINFVRHHHNKYKYIKGVNPKDMLAALRGSFQKLARIAAWGMTSSPVRLTFTTEDIKKATDEDLCSEDLQFGLLTATQVPSNLLFDSLSDNWSYIHLLFQEYFAACHLVGQPLEEVLDLLAGQSHSQHDMLRMFHTGVLLDQTLQEPLADVLPPPSGAVNYRNHHVLQRVVRMNH